MCVFARTFADEISKGHCTCAGHTLPQDLQTAITLEATRQEIEISSSATPRFRKSRGTGGCEQLGAQPAELPALQVKSFPNMCDLERVLELASPQDRRACEALMTNFYRGKHTATQSRELPPAPERLVNWKVGHGPAARDLHRTSQREGAQAYRYMQLRWNELHRINLPL